MIGLNALCELYIYIFVRPCLCIKTNQLTKRQLFSFFDCFFCHSIEADCCVIELYAKTAIYSFCSICYNNAFDGFFLSFFGISLKKQANEYILTIHILFPFIPPLFCVGVSFSSKKLCLFF